MRISIAAFALALSAATMFAGGAALMTTVVGGTGAARFSTRSAATRKAITLPESEKDSSLR